MPKINITELWLKHAHRHVDTPTEFTHEGIDLEFGVTVNPPTKRYKAGTKTFFTRYSFRGKRPRKSLGRYPTVKLGAALDRAKEIHRLAGRGIDPRQAGKQRRDELTFGELFEKFFEDRSMHRVRPEVDRWTYDRDLAGISAHVYEEMKDIREAVGSHGWGPHDLRRTVITNLARMQCPREIRMAIVNHTMSHVHDEVYDQWERAEEKKLWLTRWADFLDEIEAGDVPQVLPLAAQAV